MDSKAKAQMIWGQMNQSQRTGVRIGLFPADVIKAAEGEGYNEKDLCVALMDCAKNNRDCPNPKTCTMLTHYHPENYRKPGQYKD